jgi:hypothetical protein
MAIRRKYGRPHSVELFGMMLANAAVASVVLLIVFAVFGTRQILLPVSLQSADVPGSLFKWLCYGLPVVLADFDRAAQRSQLGRGSVVRRRDCAGKRAAMRRDGGRHARQFAARPDFRACQHSAFRLVSVRDRDLRRLYGPPQRALGDPLDCKNWEKRLMRVIRG